jgi:predicted ABC-type ATPase
MGPNVCIIAGPNGAGKTTFARKFLPIFAVCKNFVNADLIAQGMSPFSPELAAIRAGKLMFGEIDYFSRRGVDFGFETTLSGLAHLKLIRNLKRDSYRINIFYLWVPSADVAVSRVRERVSGGGHNIPEEVVRRRYDRSLRNF